ncbi:XRE family transcriptional regulator [Amycolatopsis balhimycina DSM 5908]|uniref:XRE family transcriptional regulator n=2 Tax=Amycolatopsis balhimycina TaxID=208443 RepID=A0A428VUE6_AMYBA|nr:XRE family transcriptional regulator [Amycolatopsis balhimycina DSM 5908]
MKKAREARNLGVRELGRLTGLIAQNISSWESGRRVPKIEELATILGALRVEPAERARLVNLARTAAEPNWLEQHTPTIATFVEYERTASAMTQWAPGLLPGLLQTPAYIRALFATTSRPKPDVEKQVMIRLARREVLSARHALPYQALLSEAVLHQQIGDRQMMAEQLRHLLTVSRARNVSLRVLPERSGYHPGLYGPFVLFDFDDLPSIVYLELYRGNGYVYNREHVADYRGAVETLSALALSESDSEHLVQGVITELEA